MDVRRNAEYLERLNKTSGITGVIASLLVYFAASLHGRFDWAVFFLAGGALLISWARTWVLVPVHLRNKRAEAEEWNRYVDSDWRFVSSLSGLSGAELDELKGLFRSGNDRKVRGWVQQQWSGMDNEEVQEFIRFFNEQFMDTVSAYIDDTGRLQPFD